MMDYDHLIIGLSIPQGMVLTEAGGEINSFAIEDHRLKKGNVTKCLICWKVKTKFETLCI